MRHVPLGKARWTVLAVVALIVGALGLAACGGSSGSSAGEVASLDDATTAGATDGSADPSDGGEAAGGGEASFEDALLEFTQCLREHGVDVPDPDFSGGGPPIGPGSGLDPDDPDFQEATQACEDVLPRAGGAFSAENQQEFQDAALEFAQCMREHGIDMPDPDFSGEGGGGPFGGGAAGVDPSDPDFQEAQEACGDILQELGPPGGGPSAGGANGTEGEG